MIDDLFAVSNDIRYVAVYRDGELEMQSRGNFEDASSGESDRYEELLVNPTILTLAKQRGEIDCGGMRFVVIAYGNFYQLVVPISNGHVSVCLTRDAKLGELSEQILEVLQTEREA